MRRAARLATGLGFLALLAVGLLSRYRYFNWCLHDDAFISFRYARNLVRGDGLVMNPGERVEGFTNLLWTLAAAPVLAAGADPAVVMQVLSAALSLALVLAVFLFGQRRLGSGAWALIAPAFLTGNLGFVLESLSALETMAFALLVFLAYARFLEERRGDAVAGLWAVWCGAATLVRPEGLLVFGVLAAYAAFGALRGAPAARLGPALLLYSLLVLPAVAWRWAYYDAWLPNTFYTKVGYTTAQVARGWRFTVRNFVYTATLPLLLVTAALSLAAILRPTPAAADASRGRRLAPGRARAEAIAVACLLVAAYLGYVILVGGDYEPTNRFYAPVTALVYLLFQEGLRTFVLLLGATSRPIRAGALVLALATAAGCFWTSSQHYTNVLAQRRWPHTRREHHLQLRAVGEWLQAHTPPGTRLAVSSIGALPYYADRPILDMMGLTDRTIGRRPMPHMGKGPPGHEKGDGAYVLQQQPDIILFDKGHLFPSEVELEKVLDGARGISELELRAAPGFARDYELKRVHTPAGVLHYFQRRPP